ncbi:MAG: sigma-70 family RNA polymerase sigma factor, partial [Chloroflexota bacterium]|nr:sigma-70 family RNA polymerase sigma factor [Chloroflexota bacterium]
MRHSVACAETSREAAHSPDTELARRSSLFHPPDIEHIFTQYVDRMYGFFYSRVGNRQDAEDLTSDVFLKASRQLDPTRSEASIGSWLFTVARTVLADHWRRYYRAEVSLPLDEARVSPIRVDDDSDSTVDTARQVAEVLAALPERYSRVLA